MVDHTIVDHATIKWDVNMINPLEVACVDPCSTCSFEIICGSLIGTTCEERIGSKALSLGAQQNMESLGAPTRQNDL